MMFRVMFNTAFIRSNILMLNRDEIDMLWDAQDLFPKEFRVEVIYHMASEFIWLLWLLNLIFVHILVEASVF